MTVVKEIKDIKTSVLFLLHESSKYRDSDRKLLARIWIEQLGEIQNLRDKQISAEEFLLEFIKDNTVLCTQESVGRVRRKIQEHNPALRGNKWSKRHNEQEKIKAEVKNIERNI